MADDGHASLGCTPPERALLAQRLGETVVYSPLWQRGRAVGLRGCRDQLALAVRRGALHYAGLAPTTNAERVGAEEVTDEELVVLLLHGRNPFEPFLIRAAAELLGRHAFNPIRLAMAAQRERCERVLAYIAQAGARHDPARAAWWEALLAALGPQRPVPPGLLPHWSRFVALLGVDRTRRPRGCRWIGATA